MLEAEAQGRGREGVAAGAIAVGGDDRSRLANGNTLGNFGEGGVIRELTPDMKTVFYVKFDVPTGNDFFNKMVCNNVFVDDLYALNGTGPN